jgi:hypothetical protein
MIPEIAKIIPLEERREKGRYTYISYRHKYLTVYNDNTFSTPADGLVVLQLIGQGSAISINYPDGTSVKLNNGNAIASGAIAEFEIHLQGNQTYSISGASLKSVIFVDIFGELGES